MSFYHKVTDKVYRTYLQARIAAHNRREQRNGPLALQKHISDNKPTPGFETINAPVPRDIEIQPADLRLQDVVLSCYFVNQKDPQSGIIRHKADIEYIAPWYRSVERLGLHGVIIHDGLDQDFIDRHQTERIQFRRYTGGDYSIFEERWIAYYLFIFRSGIQRAFCTDINDVYITADPFAIISSDMAIYIGRDNANKIKDSGWILDELANFEKESGIKAPPLFHHQHIYNAGVLGGSRQVLLFFMSRVIDYVVRTHSSVHKDMTILNLCIYDHFFPYIDEDLYTPRLVQPDRDRQASHAYLVSGYPLNSAFKAYDMNSDAYFIHK